jgi:hypothetical protein
MRTTPLAALVLATLAAAPAAARAQLVQEEHRLMEVHSLLLDLPPLQAPAALSPGTLDASLEAVTIPFIRGDAPPYHEITASAHTRVFPRPRLLLGLPAPGRLRASAGLSYIPPIRVRQVSTSYVAAEAGLGLSPGALRLGARVHGVYADSRAPVTDPATRDRLITGEWGADVSAGLRLGRGAAVLEPYAGLGIVALRSRFRVVVDGTVLHRSHTSALVLGGVRLLWRSRWEAVAEVDAYPGRLTHTDVRLGYLFGG